MTARLTGLVGLPVRDCLLVKPDRQIAPAAQPFVVFRPIANVVLLLLRVLVLAALGILHARTYLGHHHRRISRSARAVQQCLTEWEKAGLVKPSVIKPVLATIHKKLILRKRGKLVDADRETLKVMLNKFLG